jgi:hypothetical protein
MTGGQDNLQGADSKVRRSGKSGRKAKSKIKDNLMNYTKQLSSLGNLQQTIVLNMQKEIDKVL